MKVFQLKERKLYNLNKTESSQPYIVKVIQFILKRGVQWTNHENVVERKGMKLLENAMAYEATDIHLVPTEEGYTFI